MKIDAKHIEDMWGPRCDQYEAGCGCCDMWQMWDEIERLRRELAEAREVLRAIANRAVGVQREEHRMARAFLTASDQPPDADAEARALFYSTRNGHGWTAPEWDELAEETRQNYREFVARRASDKSSPG